MFLSIYLDFFPDHAPLLLTIHSNNPRNFGLFRFDNYWRDYLGCHDVMRNALNFVPHVSALHAFTHLLSHSRLNITVWCVIGLNSIDSELISIENAILAAENLDITIPSNHSHLMSCIQSLVPCNVKILLNGLSVIICFGFPMATLTPVSSTTRHVFVSISPISLKFLI